MLFWVGIVSLLILAGTAAALEVLLQRAQPMLRARVIQTLSTRFESRVELKEFHVSLLRGFEVSGKGLAIYPYNLESNTPTLSVNSFSFRTVYTNLLRNPMHIGHVSLTGLRINLPPKSQRKQLQMPSGVPTNGKDTVQAGGHLDIFVDEIRCSDAVLVLGTDKPGKVPLEFDIRKLTLKSVAAGQPMNFVATLINPKPVGNIETKGYFGPWQADQPGSTPVGGTYSFRNANLGTLKGIAGTLSSTGRYNGTLNRIVVDGQTNTPNFEVKISGHRVSLRTQFHAIVNGTDGDTYLQPVNAQFLHSSLTANGFVVRAVGKPGHDIQLDVVMDHASIEDLLRLGVRSDQPLMTGQVKLHTRLELPPGQQDVAQKLKLQGNFELWNAHFSDQQLQSKIDELSLRGRGDAGMAKREAKDPQTANVASRMQGNFNLANGLLTIKDLAYDVPGATVAMNGIYSLDGKAIDFFGTVSMKATLSQMVGGWKGFLLSPIDRFFENRKDKAGVQIPIKVTGTRSQPHFDLDLHHDDALERKMQQQQAQSQQAQPAPQPK